MGKIAARWQVSGAGRADFTAHQSTRFGVLAQGSQGELEERRER